MKNKVLRGVVREGVLVLENSQELPEGAQVEVEVRVVNAIESAAIFREEEWRRQSEDSWATISWGQN